MDPADFPVFEPPGAEAAEFVIPQAKARRLIKRTASAVAHEDTRYYLCGVYLVARAGRLICIATNGHKLTEAESDIDPGAMPSVIVPTRAIETLDDIARAGDVTVRVTDRRIEMSAPGRRGISKLIDATYPDYARVMPEVSDNIATVDTAALLGAVNRLDAIIEPRAKERAVGLSWSDGEFAVRLAYEDDDGIEEIEPISVSGSGHVAVQIHYLIEQIEALDGQTMTIDHGAPSAPIRITRPDETTTMVIMPMRWPPRTAVEASASEATAVE